MSKPKVRKHIGFVDAYIVGRFVKSKFKTKYRMRYFTREGATCTVSKIINLLYELVENGEKIKIPNLGTFSKDGFDIDKNLLAHFSDNLDYDAPCNVHSINDKALKDINKS